MRSLTLRLEQFATALGPAVAMHCLATGPSGKPAQGVKVTLASSPVEQTLITDAQGRAVGLFGVAVPGKREFTAAATISGRRLSQSASIDVITGPAPDPGPEPDPDPPPVTGEVYILTEDGLPLIF